MHVFHKLCNMHKQSHRLSLQDIFFLVPLQCRNFFFQFVPLPLHFSNGASLSLISIDIIYFFNFSTFKCSFSVSPLCTIATLMQRADVSNIMYFKAATSPKSFTLKNKKKHICMYCDFKEILCPGSKISCFYDLARSLI